MTYVTYLTCSLYICSLYARPRVFSIYVSLICVCVLNMCVCPSYVYEAARILSHMDGSHVTHMNMSHVTHEHESCHTHVNMSHVTHMNMSHVTHMNMSHVTHMNMSHVTHEHESRT